MWVIFMQVGENYLCCKQPIPTAAQWKGTYFRLMVGKIREGFLEMVLEFIVEVNFRLRELEKEKSLFQKKQYSKYEQDCSIWYIPKLI